MAPSSGDSDDDSNTGAECTTCRKCNKTVNDNESLIYCEGKCKSWYHSNCVNITKKQLNQIETVKNIITWMCTECKQMLQYIWKQNDNQNMILHKLLDLDTKVSQINKNIPATKISYASVVAQDIPKKNKIQLNMYLTKKP